MPVNRKSLRTAGSAALATLFLASAVCAAPTVTSGTTPEAPGIQSHASLRSTQLLQELRIVASELNRHAETLDTARRSRLSWQSHAVYLTNVRDSINDAGQVLKQLQDLHPAVAPWQQEAINRVHPVALQVAKHTAAAIDHLNENQDLRTAPEYTDRLEAIADHAADLKSTLDNFVDYAKTQDRLERLQEELKLASS